MSEVAHQDNTPDTEQNKTTFELTLTGDEMVAASEKASVLLGMMLETGQGQQVIKTLALNVHGLLTALVPHIGAASVKDILAMIGRNVDILQASIDRRAAANTDDLVQAALDAEEATQH